VFELLCFGFDKSLLAPVAYRLVKSDLFKVSPDFHQLMLLDHVTYWLLVCSSMQPQVLYPTVLRCRLIGSHKSSEMKSGISWCGNSSVERAQWTSTTLVHWPAGTLFNHKLRKMLFELRLCTSNNIDIWTFWWNYAEKWHVFPEKIDCWTCVIDWRVQWCYVAMATTQVVLNLYQTLCTTSRQYLYDFTA